MSIFDVGCQGRAQRLVQRALAAQRVPHAYIFHGPDGVGKETFARELARLLTCAAPLERPPPDLPEFADWQGRVRDACGACQHCRLMAAETHPDLHLIYRQLKQFHPDATIRERVGRDIGVEVIREFVLGPVSAKPVLARAKVFIIREADRITPQAQNALLKTLEEPPPSTFIILLASSRDRLLPTTCSRCQIIPFGPLPREFVTARLRALRQDVPAERAELFARLADGSLGAALSLAEDGMHEYNERIAAMLSKLAAGDAVSAAKALQEEAKTLGPRFHQRDREITDTEALRRGIKALLVLAATWYRDVALSAASAGELAVNQTLNALVSAGAKRWSAIAAADAIRAIAGAERELDLNVNVQLCLEALFVKLSRL